MPQRSTGSYKVKKTAPFPPGYLKLDTNGMGSSYMGRDQDLNMGEGCSLYPFRVLIQLLTEDQLDNGVKGEEIGHLEGYIVKPDKGDFIEACDEESEELYEMARLLFDEDGQLKDSEDGLDMSEIVGDVMYVEEVYVKREYRGYGLGLLATHHLIQILPHHGQLIVLLAPCPIDTQHYEGIYPDKADRNLPPTPQAKEAHRAGIKKLGKYYSLMGFEKWTTNEQDKEHARGTGIWGLWTGHTQPDIREVVPHLFVYPKARDKSLGDTRPEKRLRQE